MPSRRLSNIQLSLDLNRPPRPTVIAVPQEAVSALADLLLAALGIGADANGESGDEQQDHR
jgi:hypothetical protein